MSVSNGDTWLDMQLMQRIISGNSIMRELMSMQFTRRQQVLYTSLHELRVQPENTFGFLSAMALKTTSIPSDYHSDVKHSGELSKHTYVCIYIT